jgi:signal transduction histidine kinase
MTQPPLNSAITSPITRVAFQRPGAPSAPFRAVLIGVLVLFVVHIGFNLFAPVSPELRTAVHDVLVVVEGLAASAALFYAAKRAACYDRQRALAWGLLGAATTSYMLGDAIWTVIEVVLKQDPFPSLADVGYLPYYPLFVAGILLLPTRRLSRLERIKLLLDMGVVTIASLMVYRTFLFAPIIEQAEDPFTFAVTLTYPALDLVLLWGVIAVLLRQTQRLQIPLLLLAGSAVCLAFADSFFNYQSVTETYVSGASFTDPFYIASLLLAVLAGALEGLTQQATPADRNVPIAAMHFSRLRQLTRLVLPYLWIAVAYALLVWEHNHSHEEGTTPGFSPIALGVGVIIVFVLVRQWVMLRENEHLSTDLTRLLDASHILAAPLEMSQLPRLIQTELRRLLRFDQVSIWIAQDKNTLIAFQESTPGTEPQALPNEALNVTEDVAQLLEAAQPIPVTYTTDAAALDDPLPQRLFARQMFARQMFAKQMFAKQTTWPILSWIAAPLVTNDRRAGLLVIGCSQAHAYDQSHANLLRAFANQAAAAIENAQLRRQEAIAAAAAERARLARELHDSVSQALFGISLGTRTTRELIPTNTQQALASTDYVLNLTDGALAEMRALIFELRPENLVTEGLLVALQKQVAALCKRHNLDASITAMLGEPALSIECKEALYRITLEALQNTIKHAQATQVQVRLNSDDASATLEVRDNGKGFDTEAKPEGHYGLISMRERAERCGATFEVEGQPGRGTLIRVRMPATPISAPSVSSAPPREKLEPITERPASLS